MRKHYLTLILSIVVPSLLFSTGDSLHFLTAKDTVFVQVNESGRKSIEHILEKGQTLYSLAGFYGLKLETLLSYNPGLNPDRPFLRGQAIKVPMPDSALVIEKEPKSNGIEYAPVFYVVKQNETLYRISKVFFKIPIELLKANNSLINENLKVGQKLQIGWLSTSGIPDSLQTSSFDPTSDYFADLKSLFEFEGTKLKPSSHKGAAYWYRERKNEKEFFALHRFALPGTVIQITNPMRRTVTYAKVVGAISDRIHGKEIIAVLSAPVARQLGAKDSKFFVEIKYYK
jgi:LysM repeat protein